MDRVCPLLGLVGDRRSVIDGVDASHRCHAETPPQPLSRQEQAQLCLTPTHPRCERYLRHVAASGGGLPGLLPIGDGLVSTRMVLTPTPAWRGIAGRARRAPRGPLVAGAGAAIVLGAAGIAVASGLIGPGEAGASPTPSARASSSPSPTPSASPTPTASPLSTPSPTVEATAAPTVVPTAAVTPVPTPAPPPPPAPTSYVVQQGDTLAAIAQQFGTTVQALQAANGIEDPDEIFVGQVLVIP